MEAGMAYEPTVQILRSTARGKTTQEEEEEQIPLDFKDKVEFDGNLKIKPADAPLLRTMLCGAIFVGTRLCHIAKQRGAQTLPISGNQGRRRHWNTCGRNALASNPRGESCTQHTAKTPSERNRNARGGVKSW